MKIHPNDALLEELLLALGSEHRTLLEHALDCSYCRARLHSLPSPERGKGAERIAKVLGWLRASDYEESLERSTKDLKSRELALRKERNEAPALYVELTELPSGQREFLLRNVPRFHTWGLFELLVQRSWEMAVGSPAYSEELARLAILVSECLRPDAYNMELVEDLRARAWAYIGNAQRVRSDLQGAEQSFEVAYYHLQKGTRELLERAIFLDLKASLLRDQRRFDGATRLLRRAISIFLQEGEEHRAGRSLVKLSTVYDDSGRPEDAIPALSEALGLIDPEQEPRLLLSAWHNLSFVLADLGRFLEAQSLYRKARPLYRELSDAWTQNRRKWLKAKILHGLGQSFQAEALYLAAQTGFIEEGIPYDTALVSLELATLYAGQGRTAELRRLAEQMVPIFASRQIHREALAALAYLKQAAEAEKASFELVARVAAFVKRAQFDPGARFEGAVA
ncbi:MAG TPA: tetratricopeptide repeat protein [Thermoanaerobaculia bacterium]|nr:tetratricopeptide repeat protein [Thermoanaerobaculia bacterium]